MNNRNRMSSGDRVVLERIVALLLSLAALAERAAGRSFVLRLLLFCIMRQAEFVARRLVVDRAYCFETLASDGSVHDTGLEQTGLIRLAISFRIIAALLAEMIIDAIAWEMLVATSARGLVHQVHTSEVARGFIARIPLIDTS